MTDVEVICLVFFLSFGAVSIGGSIIFGSIGSDVGLAADTLCRMLDVLRKASEERRDVEVRVEKLEEEMQRTHGFKVQ